VKEDAFFIVAKIVGVHGVRGNVKLHAYVESLSLLEPGATVVVGDPESGKGRYTIRWAKPHHRTVLMSLKNVDDRDAAEMLVGADVFMEKSRLPDLEEGSYYWSDLIGMAVVTTDGQSLGRIASILRTGSNDVYVVREGAGEILIPALVSVVKTVDPGSNTMTVDLPEGLA